MFRHATQSGCTIYLHIPKTGGSTFGLLLARTCPRAPVFAFDGNDSIRSLSQFSSLPSAQRASYRVLKGHVPFGVHVFVPQPAVYITLLRDPVERVVSSYYHVLRVPAHPLHSRLLGQRVSLADYASLGIEMDNLQTRYLSGVFPFSWHTDLPRNENSTGPCTEKTLQLALANFEQHFAAVGLTERFDESLALMAHYLGWPGIPAYERLMVGTNRPAREAVAPEAIEAIRQANIYDMQLYAHACRRFDQYLRSCALRKR